MFEKDIKAYDLITFSDFNKVRDPNQVVNSAMVFINYGSTAEVLL